MWRAIPPMMPAGYDNNAGAPKPLFPLTVVTIMSSQTRTEPLLRRKPSDCPLLPFGHQSALPSGLDRLVDERGRQSSPDSVFDGTHGCHHGDAAHLLEVFRTEITLPDPVALSAGLPGTVGRRDGDVDLARVHIAELVKPERGVVGDDAPSPCPQRGLHEVVVARHRPSSKAIQTVRDPGQPPPCRKLSQLGRVDAEFRGIRGRDVAAL